jgi:SAM-dependent methyltransferase
MSDFQRFERAGWSRPDIAAGYQAALGEVARQSVDALLDLARVGAGTRLLDLATGPGTVAGAAAGRGAASVGIDFSPAQVALAARAHPGIDFRTGDAEALPFPDGAFDAVTIGFAMMHFADPLAVLRECRRVLRADGRVAFSAWAAPARAAAFGIFYGTVQAHGRLDVGLPPGPDFFRFSTVAACRDVLGEAGFVDPSVVETLQSWRLTDPDAVYRAIESGAVRARALLEAQTAAARAAIRAAMREALAARARDDEIVLPMPAILAAGTRH